MRNPKNSKYEILKAALKQFAEKGYFQAGIRDIANDAGVSLGLVNHYFESKKNLASNVIAFFWYVSGIWSGQYADPVHEPVLYDAIITRGMNCLMTGQDYRKFYMESLKEDIFYGSFKGWHDGPLAAFKREAYKVPDQDMIMLYSRILPYEVEKTLILKKEEGMFQKIPYEDIPFYICLTALERVVPEEAIRAADAQARADVSAHIHDLEQMITDEAILQFVGERL